MNKPGHLLRVEGRELRVNNLDKILVPASGTRKADVLDYYVKASGVLLPHLENRPLTLKLFIDGFGAPVRYLKNAPPYTPEWVKIAPMHRKDGGPVIRFVLVNDLPTLLWTASLSNIEMHTILACAPKLDRPTMIVFDLDPGPVVSLAHAAEVALRLRDALAVFDLQAFIKSSGSKGLHVLVPLNTPVDYEATRVFAKGIAEQLERESPGEVTTTMSKAERRGKIFIDYTQNAAYKSTACVYSLRATERGAFVSMPLEWTTLEKRELNREEIFPTVAHALELVQSTSDLFASVLKLRQKLPAFSKVSVPARRLTRGKTVKRASRLRQKV